MSSAKHLGAKFLHVSVKQAYCPRAIIQVPDAHFAFTAWQGLTAVIL